MRWDAFLNVPDPDSLAAEFASHAIIFSEPLQVASFLVADL
jgi:hypothetical protein